MPTSASSPSIITRVLGGRTWQINTALPPAVAELCAADLAALRNRPDVTVMGDKRFRSTFLAPCGDGLVLVKAVRPLRGGPRVQSWLLGRPNSREWRWACRFADAQLAVPRPWAFHDGGPDGTSWFLQEGLPDVLHLAQYCGKHLWPPTGLPPLWQALAAQLGTLIAGIHRLGADHPDLHPGNLLCSGDSPETLGVSLVDYHSVRHGVGPRRRYQAANVAKLFVNLQGYLSPERWHDLLAAYVSRCRPGAWSSVDDLARRVDVLVPRLMQRRAHSRACKAFVNSSAFQVERRGARRVWRRRSVATATVLDLVDQVNAGELDTHITRPDRAAYRLALPDGSPVWIKTYGHRGVAKQLEARIRRTYGRRAWYAVERLHHLWISAPEGLAYVEEWAGPRLLRSHLILRHVEHLVDLDTLLFAGSRLDGDRRRIREKRRLITALAALVRRLHDLGVYHSDLSTKNILVGRTREGWQLTLIDIDGVRFPRLGVRRRHRARNLAQLTGLPSTITLRDRLRFLRAYGAGRATLRDGLRDAPRIMRLGAKTQRFWGAREVDAIENRVPGPHVSSGTFLDQLATEAARRRSPG